MSTPASSQGMFAGSRSEKTIISSPSTIREPSAIFTSPSNLPYVESYLRKMCLLLRVGEVVDGDDFQLIGVSLG